MYVATLGYIVITTYNECAIVQVGAIPSLCHVYQLKYFLSSSLAFEKY